MEEININDLRRIVENRLVNNSILIEVEDLIVSRIKWRKISNISEFIAHVLLIVTTILAFTGGIYEFKLLYFFTGCASTTALGLLKFSSYAIKESKERTETLNVLLTRLYIPTFNSPIISEIVNRTHNNTPEYY
jgi:hypothetical protein